MLANQSRCVWRDLAGELWGPIGQIRPVWLFWLTFGDLIRLLIVSLPLYPHPWLPKYLTDPTTAVTDITKGHPSGDECGPTHPKDE